MAEIDPNIALQARSPQFANPVDLATNAIQLRNLGIQGQNQQIALQQNQRALQDQKTIADLYRSNVDPTTGAVNHAGVVQGLAQAGLGDKIPAYQQQVATASKDTTAADAAQFSLHKQKLDLIGNTLSSLVSKPDLTHDDAINALSSLVQQGAISPDQGAQASRNLPGRPEQLRPYLIQQGLQTMDASKQIEARLATAPKYNAQDTGGGINQGTVDPLTGQRTAGATVAKTVSADTSANIAKDLTVARMNSGVGPDGKLNAGGEALAQGLAAGTIPWSARLENPKGEAIIARAMEIDPKMDIPKLQARAKAIDQYTNGLPAQSLQANGTAVKHLTLLNGLIDNLDNTNSPAFNSIKNLWETQTGGSAPNNLDLAKTVAADEVMKSIVPGAGGEAERMALAEKMRASGSPKALKDAVGLATQLMNSQKESFIQRGRNAGVPDSVFVDYTEGASGKPATANNASAVPVKSDADYNALKSGTRFTAPDGSVRVKP
jgi:hypothetical protein